MVNIEPIKLKHNRIERPFKGGYLLDKLQLVEKPRDGYMSESWIASTTKVFNDKKDSNYGLSKCVINNKEYLLKDLINKYPKEFLGEKHIKNFGVEMAILVKFIDSFSRLLIQVHPNKDYAKKYLNSDFGKTEAWHILDIREDIEERAYIYLGFKEGITREKWRQAFLEQDIEGMISMMHKFYVNKGDTIFIPSGVPHALGGGCLVIEIQEPTDFTMRVERKRLDGGKISEDMIHNGLGIEKMLDCFDYEGINENELIERYFLKDKKIIEEEKFKKVELIGEKYKEYFTMEKLEINKKIYIEQDKFCISTVVEGKGKLTYLDKDITLEKGDEIFIPEYNRNFTLEGENLKIINCYSPKV
ncbi:Probable mannose-6-phosphate isomerase gmuF [uncultured Clostridium sp.]|uniref:type I phosphomannose isomerase catalytic subunit n=1 Tax=uncultured Clostridium sp. TaxID=59620 RepID=UPI00082242B7|nr:type I phosphomannose isomerase catalytic subunit [uncultured Clostridium sp.]SCJ59329.1 Probable mannose-6-phosphate isomerase gmuF [uncultured Clostridium sp.]